MLYVNSNVHIFGFTYAFFQSEKNPKESTIKALQICNFFDLSLSLKALTYIIMVSAGSELLRAFKIILKMFCKAL